MQLLLLACAILTAALATYALGHYTAVAAFWLGRPEPRTFADYPTDSVAVLIPALNEGERALRAIHSLLAQDHAGPLHIALLVNNSSDTAIPSLAAAWPDVDFNQPVGTLLTLESSEQRRVSVLYAGMNPKSDKVNAMAARIEATWTGILDCDHQAHPMWVRTSLCLLHESGVRMIQGRRRAISAQGFFQLWDSLHQHVGCELFNLGFTRMGLTVFFTGSTAIVDTALLRKHPLGNCITEDTDFGYTLLLEGERIIHNAWHGSDEETSPDLYSFLARRRRWAAGHTETFLRHLPQLSRSPMKPAERVQFLFHGSHYLVSLVVFALHGLIGLYFVSHLSKTSAVAAVLAGIVLSVFIGHSQRTPERWGRAVEVFMLFNWFMPAIVIVFNLTQGALMHDFGRAVLPIGVPLQIIGLVGLASPLVVLLVGLLGLGELGLGSLLAVLLTWPVAFYLDIGGVLLGMSDQVTRSERWRPVARAAAPNTAVYRAPAALLPTTGIRQSYTLRVLAAFASRSAAEGISLMNKPLRWLTAAAVTVLFCAGVMYTPTETLDVVPTSCTVMEHDGDPWIVPAAKLDRYCDADPSIAPLPGTRTGAFEQVRHDDFKTLDTTYWDELDDTFFCNLSGFSPDNVTPSSEGLVLRMDHTPSAGKDVSSGSIATKDDDAANFTYGRFEAVMKPPRAEGVLTAFFLYRFDPWQEIDLEFLGRDPTKLLLNVYYNPGEQGDLYNYGHRGTPVVIDLGFDASEDFHTYAIEWERDEIRWLVDDRVVHVRSQLRPTPIPHLPMRVHLNTWPICSEELAGTFDPSVLPIQAEVREVNLSVWHPPPVNSVRSLLGLEGGEWRQTASWLR